MSRVPGCASGRAPDCPPPGRPASCCYSPRRPRAGTRTRTAIGAEDSAVSRPHPYPHACVRAYAAPAPAWTVSVSRYSSTLTVSAREAVSRDCEVVVLEYSSTRVPRYSSTQALDLATPLTVSVTDQHNFECRHSSDYFVFFK